MSVDRILRDDFIEKAEDKCNYRGAKGLGLKRNQKSCDKLYNAGCKWMEKDGRSGCVLDWTKKNLEPLKKMDAYLNMSKEERKALKESPPPEEEAEGEAEAALKKKKRSKHRRKSKKRKPTKPKKSKRGRRRKHTRKRK